MLHRRSRPDVEAAKRGSAGEFTKLILQSFFGQQQSLRDTGLGRRSRRCQLSHDAIGVIADDTQ
jgi:hypothetical protein